MKKMDILNRMYESVALAIVRVETIERACEIADGCIKGGVPVM
ncbi:ketohydroxyglutarate aldolase, partial [Bacillus thuringiensis]|nr:ketohydroxyglutarate aldolase [Bacillus thuringiensis]